MDNEMSKVQMLFIGFLDGFFTWQLKRRKKPSLLVRAPRL